MNHNRTLIFSIALMIAIYGFVFSPSALFAKSNEQETVVVQNNSYQVTISTAVESMLPATIQAGDSIIWSNQTTQTIIIEQNIGFRIFLPVVQGSAQSTAQTESKPEPATPGSEHEGSLGGAVMVWKIQPGEIVEVQYTTPNYYTLRIQKGVSYETSVTVSE